MEDVLLDVYKRQPLSEIAAQSGSFISRGVSVDSLDTEKKWKVHITVSEGEQVSGGTVIAETQETTSILHRSMVPPNLSGRVTKVVEDGEYTIKDTLMVLELDDGTTQELDVYKRQALCFCCRGYSHEAAPPDCDGGSGWSQRNYKSSGVSPEKTAVSYTHLDVYKRQVISR